MNPESTAPRRFDRVWPWLALGMAAVWVITSRVPLVINAASHLDSDLAVDGLTLLDAAEGHWRWHYPGTPFIGIGPVLLSWPQAKIWGANPITLVSGGTIAFLGLLFATFTLGWKAFGPGVAAWSLLPLTFGSTGIVWLSGRITGGHLVAAIWHAGAFAILVSCLERRRPRNWAILGLWCGVGIWLDSMFALTLAGLVPAAVLGVIGSGGAGRFLAAAAVFTGAFVVGAAPRAIGQRLDPHNAYQGQFDFVSEPGLLLSHSRTLVAECLPRLVAGHQFPGLETDPEPASLSAPATIRRRGAVSALAIAVTATALVAFVAAMIQVLVTCVRGTTRTSRAVAIGLVISSAATLAGFIANWNIFNSDNYRYLVDLLVPWSIGFGVFTNGLTRQGGRRAACAWLFAVVFAGLMTADLARWYARFGWLGAHDVLVQVPVEDPALAWLDAHPEVTWISGGYWDVYRLAFLTGGRVKGAPFPIYPNRFPDWQPSAWGTQAVIVRASPEGRAFRESALREGAKLALQTKGLSILVRP